VEVIKPLYAQLAMEGNMFWVLVLGALVMGDSSALFAKEQERGNVIYVLELGRIWDKHVLYAMEVELLHVRNAKDKALTDVMFVKVLVDQMCYVERVVAILT